MEVADEIEQNQIIERENPKLPLLLSICYYYVNPLTIILLYNLLYTFTFVTYFAFLLLYIDIFTLLITSIYYNDLIC